MIHKRGRFYNGLNYYLVCGEDRKPGERASYHWKHVDCEACLKKLSSLQPQISTQTETAVNTTNEAL